VVLITTQTKMASTSFRESMNSLGWSRREADAPVSTAAPSVMDRVSNLFGAGGYVRLPISETNPGAPLPAPTRREEEEGWFARKYTHLVLPCWIADRLLCGSLYLEVHLKQLFSGVLCPHNAKSLASSSHR
jgi:hypothetical protein